MDSKQNYDALNSHCPRRLACGPAQPDDHDDHPWLHYAKRLTRVQLPRQHVGTAIRAAHSISCGDKPLMREPSYPLNRPINGSTTKNRKA